MKKWVSYVVLALLPALLIVNFARIQVKGKESGFDVPFYGVKVTFDYFSTYDTNDIDELKSTLASITEIGFSSYDFDPDFSGGYGSDILEVVKALLNGIKALWQYIAWFFASVWKFCYLSIKTVLWIFGYIPYVVSF